jgi:TRAP-type mannitol/chloroaromatic compound transport system permease small subunit
VEAFIFPVAFTILGPMVVDIFYHGFDLRKWSILDVRQVISFVIAASIWVPFYLWWDRRKQSQ